MNVIVILPVNTANAPGKVRARLRYENNYKSRIVKFWSDEFADVKAVIE